MIPVLFTLWHLIITLGHIPWVWSKAWSHTTVASTITNSLFFGDIFMLSVSFCHMEYVVMSIFMSPAIGSGN